MIKIGDIVCKKSRKKFQNGKRTALVIGDNSYIRTPKGFIDAFELKGCEFPVTKITVHDDGYEIKLLQERDIIDEIGGLK